ncbi:MAG: aspartate 1-decarboxylase [Zavarzinella sp.]
MQRFMFKSKIHRATVTDSNLDYEGSLTVDPDLLEAADILPYEQIHVWDVTNGARLVTYALVGTRGSGEVCVNGAGAHLIHPGHIVIIATYTSLNSEEAVGFEPTVVQVNEKNEIRELSPKTKTDPKDKKDDIHADLEITTIPPRELQK